MSNQTLISPGGDGSLLTSERACSGYSEEGRLKSFIGTDFQAGRGNKPPTQRENIMSLSWY